MARMYLLSVVGAALARSLDGVQRNPGVHCSIETPGFHYISSGLHSRTLYLVPSS